MLNLVPEFILNKLNKNEMSGIAEGSALFVDIKGFTHMTETLMKENDKGSEILSEIINEIFHSLISPIHKYNGFIATFAGDAFTAIFPDDTGINSAGASIDIVREIEKNRIKKTVLGDFEIAVRIGVSAGVIEWAIVGDDSNLSYYFKGQTIDDAAEAEAESLPNEINLHESVLKNLPADFFQEKENKYFLLKSSKIKKPSLKTEIIENDHLTGKFFNIKLMPEKFTGEFRDASSLFVSFRNYDAFEKINSLMKMIINYTREYKGYFNMIDFGDKGAKVVILFGAPVSFEKNLERSIECAKAIVSLDEKNIRAALTYGRVYAGYIGSRERCTYTILGDKVNMSARIMSSSPYGALWTEKHVAEEMKWKYVFSEIGEILFKGKSRKEMVYEIKSKKNLSREETLFENEIVGREREVGRIQQIVDEKLMNGKFGGVVNIYGDPGVGKSRLMFEIMQKNSEVCTIALLKNDDIYNKSFLPFEIFLKKLFGQINNESEKQRKDEFENSWKRVISASPECENKWTDEEISHTKDMLKGFLKIAEKDSQWESMDSKLKFENAVFAIKHLLKIISLEKPLIICVEDIQWQDKESNEVFKVLARKIEDYPILVVTTSRYSDDGSKITLPVEAECPVNEITVGLFDLEQSRDYISKQLIFSPSENLIEKIFQKTEGNPFYIEQISLYLIENEILEIKNDEYCLKKDIEDIPQGINAIIIARIDRLTRELKEMVQSAAVLGREFEIDVLSKMLSGRMDEKSLSEGVDEKIWQPLNQLKYIFKHNMMRDAAYNMQLKNKLKELHLVAANALERIHGKEMEKYADMAYHYEKGEVFDKAKYYYKETGIESKNNFRNYDAEKYLLAALKYSDDRNEYFDLNLALGEVYYQMGEWEKTKIIYENLVSGMKEADDDIRKARTFLAYGELLFERGEIEMSKESFKKAEVIFQTAQNREGMTMVLMGRAQTCWRAGDLDISRELYQKALDMAEELNNSKLIAEILLTMGNINKDKCEFNEAMEYYEKSKKLCTENNHKTGLCGVIGNMGLIEWMKGNYEKAMDYFNEEMEVAKTIGSKFVLSYIYGNMGSVYFHMNLFDKAEEHYLKQIAIAEELGEKKNIRIALNNLGGVCEMRGDYEKELDYFQKSLKIAEELNAKMGIRIVLSNIGNVYGKWGQHDKSLDYFTRSLKIAEELGDKRGISILKMNLACSYNLLGDIERAEENIDEALKIMIEYNLNPNMAKALLEKSKILFKKEKYDEALVKIEEGLKALEKGEVLLSESERIGLIILKCLMISKRNKEEGKEKLLELLNDAKEKSDIGDVYNALLEISGDDSYRIKAIESYEQYYSSHPVKEIEDKIKSLRREK
ncbi:MAG: tetratricopeptide repeat protein [bacterium]